MKLTNLKHEKFCLEYAKSGNGTEAYKKAGYKPKDDNSANANSVRLLRKDKIQTRLAELHDEIKSEKIANAAEIQERLTSILRMEMQEEVVVVEGVEKGVTEAKIILKKPSNADAIKAAQTLAKMQGAYDNSLSINIAVPVFTGEESLEE